MFEQVQDIEEVEEVVDVIDCIVSPELSRSPKPKIDRSKDLNNNESSNNEGGNVNDNSVNDNEKVLESDNLKSEKPTR